MSSSYRLHTALGHWRDSWLRGQLTWEGIPVPQIASYFMNFISYPERKPSRPSSLERIFKVPTFRQWIIWVYFVYYLNTKARLLLPFRVTSANHIIYLFHPSCFLTCQYLNVEFFCILANICNAYIDFCPIGSAFAESLCMSGHSLALSWSSYAVGGNELLLRVWQVKKYK